MSNLNIKLGLSGHFVIKAHKEDGSSRVVAEFTNIITNNGLDLFGTNNLDGCTAKVCVGTGNTVPVAGDTALASFLATASTTYSSSITIDQVGRYVFYSRSYQFGLGQAAGNISEIGIGVSSTNLFSRALIKDNNGDPTTITILSNEYLTVSYQVKIKQPVSDVLDTIDGYDVTLRPSRINLSDANGWNGNGMYMLADNFFNYLYASSGGISSIEGAPSLTTRIGSANNSAYVPGSFTRTATFFLGTNIANYNISAFFAKFGPGAWQFSVSPAIAKNNTDELTIGMSISWAREGEL